MESLNTVAETHPLFPSGDWTGFYNFSWSKDKHMMDFQLNFNNGTVLGRGTDDVAPFHWKGTYDTKILICNMVKFYPSHTVLYNGYVDENGIWGTWSIGSNFTGGFHLWPKAKGEAVEVEEVDQLVIKKDLKITVANNFQP